MKKEIVFEILGHLDAFENQKQNKKEYNINDFVDYLNTQKSVNSIEMRSFQGDKETYLKEISKENNSEISILITLMSRYAKGYIKKALQNSLLNTVDEFSFLITLMTYESLTKTEITNKIVMEKTSGVEVIKRLLGQELIKEFANEKDKRSVRVAITPKGKNEILNVLPEMNSVSKIVIGNLNNVEINTLSFLLKKLDFYHNDIFMNKRSWSLNEILNK